MHRFKVEGPLAIPFTPGKAAKSILTGDVKQFWEHHPSLAKGRGCYIFAIRAGGGITPAYVGKATKTFKQEIFTNDKLAKYQRTLADYKKGTPVMFLLISQQKVGKPNALIVKELEDYLIQTALSANENLLNVQGTKRAQFCITGVLRSGSGKPSQAATSLKSCLNITP